MGHHPGWGPHLLGRDNSETGPTNSSHQDGKSSPRSPREGSPVNKSGLTGLDGASHTFTAQTGTGVLGQRLNKAPA